MTVITYSSAAGSRPKEIQVLEHPSASVNFPEPFSEILEPWTMLDSSENTTLESCGVEGQRWTKETQDEKTEGGAKGEILQRKRQTWGREVERLRKNRGVREEPCNSWKGVIGKDSKESGQNWVKGKDKSKMDVSGILSAAETDGELNQCEKMTRVIKSWPVCLCLFLLKKVTEEKGKRGKNFIGMRWHHILPWSALLFLILFLKSASSQVRVAFKRQF